MLTGFRTIFVKNVSNANLHFREIGALVNFYVLKCPIEPEKKNIMSHLPTYRYPGLYAGRLTLTDHALYFEAHRVVSYEKAKIYDLAEDLKQVVKPELTGPWGTRLFDKAVFYKSVSL